MICPRTYNPVRPQNSRRTPIRGRRAKRGAALLATARARNAGMWEEPSQPGGARRRGDQSRRPPGGDVRGELVASEWGADFSSPRVSTCSVDGDTRSMPARAGRGGAGVCEAWAPLVTPL